MSHGWIKPNKNGMVARCGGPFICSICQQEFKDATEQERINYINKCVAEQQPVLTVEIIQEIETRKSSENRDTIASKEGKRAWREHIPISKNPYSKDSSAYLAWQNAWFMANSAYTFCDPEGL